MIKEEVRNSLIQSKTLSIFIILQFTLSFFIGNTLFFNTQDMRKSNMEYSSRLSDKEFYYLSDHSMNDEDLELSQLKSFYDELSKSEGYTYYEITDQPVYIANFKGGDTFRYGYEDGFASEEADTILNDTLYIFVKALMLNQNISEEYGLEVIEGRNFTADDYLLNGETIPAILGYEYSNKYRIGETLTIDYLTKDLDMEIVGFYKKDEAIAHQGELIYLDRYVVLPSVTCLDEEFDDEESTFQKMHYLNKINGSIAMNEGYSLTSFIERLEELRGKYNIFDFAVLGITNIDVKMMKIASNRNLDLMIFLTSIMIIFAVVSLSVIMTCKLDKNKRKYAIHLVYGGKLSNIITYIIGEGVLIIALSHLLAFMLTIFFFRGAVFYTLQWIMISFIPLLIACIQPIYYLSRSNISTMIRRKD